MKKPKYRILVLAIFLCVNFNSFGQKFDEGEMLAIKQANSEGYNLQKKIPQEGGYYTFRQGVEYNIILITKQSEGKFRWGKGFMDVLPYKSKVGDWYFHETLFVIDNDKSPGKQTFVKGFTHFDVEWEGMILIFSEEPAKIKPIDITPPENSEKRKAWLLTVGDREIPEIVEFYNPFSGNENFIFQGSIELDSEENLQETNSESFFSKPILVGANKIYFGNTNGKLYYLKGHFIQGVIDGPAELWVSSGGMYKNNGQYFMDYELEDYLFFESGNLIRREKYKSDYGGLGILSCAVQYGLGELIKDPTIGAIVTEGVVSHLEDGRFSSTDAAISAATNKIIDELRKSGKSNAANVIKGSLLLNCLIENW